MDRTFKHGEETIKAGARRERDTIHLSTSEGEHSFQWESLGPGDYLVRDGNKLRRCVVARQGEQRWVWIEGHVHHLEVVSGSRRRSQSSGGMTAPMPGQVLTVLVAAGDPVTKGQTLVIMEAMKMQCEIKAPRDGVVKTVAATEGEQVASGFELVALEDTGS